MVSRRGSVSNVCVRLDPALVEQHQDGAALSGDHSGDEQEGEDESVLSGNFINDGSFTQGTSTPEDGFAFYHRVDRKVAASPDLFAFDFGRKQMVLPRLQRALAGACEDSMASQASASDISMDDMPQLPGTQEAACMSIPLCDEEQAGTQTETPIASLSRPSQPFKSLDAVSMEFLDYSSSDW
jgi:hypothetical protein